MDEWKEGVFLAIDVFMASMTLTLMVVLGSVGQSIWQFQQNSENTIAIMQEFRKYNMYDGTTVMPQDIITLILASRGEPEVDVYYTDTIYSMNYTWKWSDSQVSCPYDDGSLSSLLPLSGNFASTIVYDINGAIIRIEFRG